MYSAISNSDERTGRLWNVDAAVDVVGHRPAVDVNWAPQVLQLHRRNTFQKTVNSVTDSLSLRPSVRLLDGGWQ